jgi:sRNA-binding carbon storage regulator CsrA
MLVLNRETSGSPWFAGPRSEILIGDAIKVIVLGVRPDGVVEVGIDAPREIVILRGELAAADARAAGDAPRDVRLGPPGAVPGGPAARYREAARRGCRGAGGCGGRDERDGRDAFGYPDRVGEGR